MEDAVAEVEYLARRGITDAYLFGAEEELPEEKKQLIRRISRASATPGAVVDLERMNLEIDIRGVLSSIQVHTLVMNRTTDPTANAEAARDLAAHIAGARFVEFPGDTHSFTMGGVEVDDVVAEIQEFVTGSRPEPLADRVLASVLFTDIVGSTKKAAELGDRAWRDLVERHH
jgi:pimeloyl-ACP methyl ester carboxylesterase